MKKDSTSLKTKFIDNKLESFLAEEIYPNEFLSKIKFFEFMDIEKSIINYNSTHVVSESAYEAAEVKGFVDEETGKFMVTLRQAVKFYPFLDWQKVDNWEADGLIYTKEIDTDTENRDHNLIRTAKTKVYALQDFEILSEKDTLFQKAIDAGLISILKNEEGKFYIFRRFRVWNKKDQTQQVGVMRDLAVSVFGKLAQNVLLEEAQKTLTDEEIIKFTQILDKALPGMEEKVTKKYNKQD